MAGRYVEISNGVNEGMARAHADCARVLASGSPTWDSVDSDRVWVGPALVHLGLAQRYWKRSAEVEDGDLRLFTDLSCIVADVDASAGGYGFVWRDREGKIVRAEAKVQSRSMAVGSWHCNRRELFVIAACLRRLDEEVHLFPHLREVEIRGDSRVAVHQADPWNVPACKSVERRAILRLRGVVAEVTHALNCSTPSVSVKFSHLPGERNGIADALSRVSLSLKYVPVPDGSSAMGIVHCDAVEVHSWLSDRSAGIHSIPSFRRWKALRVAFLGWCGSDAPSPQAELFTKFLLAKQAEDGFCSRVLDECDTSQVSAIPGLPYSFQVREGLLYRVRPNVPIDDGPRWQLVVPRDLVGELSLAVHQECGHAGLTATLAGLYGVAWAPAMRKLARKALRGCLSCALTRDCGSRAQISYGASRIPTAPYDCVGIDMYGPLRALGIPGPG
ncbi:hypothetical protein Pmar_PMAR002683 [Perkinsus marinus ATCC 50983]|uniref:Integrase zinc-binding domain-containing protein n=1 Tax=Perkinsus marinus (strain ATCC 50983 / TXsc) TaxID=423536 RepID=C5KED5_PERM5|nr:hypothetical protein Pmar_PMAR002683 [Perkinsus marinus ATCC 50983]EER17158.1 hypothetical protein Pmar_PMAR002683 [Perkinsus marinus ATCC 50983]|eukprot:XP_002785362.1 hypothetical protein Pmar_PMAR002683 [Perkinsus marinus ATCC 50983]